MHSAVVCSSIAFFVAINAQMASAWTTRAYQIHRMLSSQKMETMLYGGPFFEEEYEFECPEEDECEIDWDKMPQPKNEVENMASPYIDCDDEEECEIDWDAMPDAQQDESIPEDEPTHTSRMSTGGIQGDTSSWKRDE